MKTILVDAWNTFFTEEGLFHNMYEMLEQYDNPKMVVTNADDAQLVEFGITASPYEVFTLKHQPDKVDPRYFETLLQQYKLDAKDVLYFEHNLDAVHSAQSLGITAFHYNKDKKDLGAVKAFLDANL